ncbi:MAG: hypothetical protein U0T73_11985 [Chitinophagales bacterium]
MIEIPDFIVVGSGCTGAMAAQTLVESGRTVLLLDGGLQEKRYQSLIPDADFIKIRKNDPQQHRYFLGDHYEGVPLGKIKTGEHLTPPRKFMTALTETFLPVLSDNFMPLESLAYGGLGNGWGLGCCIFSDEELRACTLPEAEMKAAYQVVADRIGISGCNDDAAPYTAGKLPLQAPIQMDSNGKRLYSKYQKHRGQLNARGFYLGRPSLALITQEKNGRKPYQYKDLDFYDDQDESAYRPWITINALLKKNNFSFIGDMLVLSYQENSDGVEVHCISISNQSKHSFKAKKLVLCPGVLGTARIVLRSHQSLGTALPLLCNPYSYLPCLQPLLLGKDNDPFKIGFAQLSLFYDPQQNNFDVGMASIYSYRSMMAFHILKETPMGVRDAYTFLKYMMPAFTIIGLHHSESQHPDKWVKLNATKNEIGQLEVNYPLSDQQRLKIAHTEKQYAGALRRLQCFVLKNIEPQMGASIHYAGTLPQNAPNEKFRLSSNGKLGQTQHVYVADGSGFTYLPAKGLTFSLMANAHRVAVHALQEAM